MAGDVRARPQPWFPCAVGQEPSAESVLAYATLTELLVDVEAAEFGDLPAAERGAIERIRRDDHADARTHRPARQVNSFSVQRPSRPPLRGCTASSTSGPGPS
ncbi:hypothetical protein ABQF33_17060 [Mycolicibacterium sp. XJ2]